MPADLSPTPEFDASKTTLTFAGFVATLGRGPGRSRPLTRDEAREAFGLVLDGRVDPHQVGAFLMLLRYRGEDADEVTGLVEAARATLPKMAGAADLDWPSYGAGRTREQPWFLLAALALAQGSRRVLMHGTNDFSAGVSVVAALTQLGLEPARDPADAARRLARDGFAYLPIESLSPPIARLLGLRALFGLRSPVNTVARLLNPADAAAGVDGVFHPPYIEAHLGVAARMNRPRLLVVKGGGGEAERNPAKPMTAHLWRELEGQSELLLPALASAGPSDDTPSIAAVWHGDAAPGRVLATIQATIALGLLALGDTADANTADDAALDLWNARRR